MQQSATRSVVLTLGLVTALAVVLALAVTVLATQGRPSLGQLPVMGQPPSFVVWSYGGVEGTGKGELKGPHMAEELDGDKLLIAEEDNHDVIVVDKASGRIVWQFGERGIRGSDERHLYRVTSAHRLKDGNIIITDAANRRVLVVSYATRKILWEYISPGDDLLLDAIEWDEQHFMVSDQGQAKVIKLRK